MQKLTTDNLHRVDGVREKIKGTTTDPYLVETAIYDRVGSRLEKRKYNNGMWMIMGHLDSGSYVSGYDTYFRAKEIRHFKNGDSDYKWEFDYDYDKNSNRKWEKYKHPDMSSSKYNVYAYDGLDRISNYKYWASDPNGTGPTRNVTYNLDKVGNRKDDASNIGRDDAGSYGPDIEYDTVNALNQYIQVKVGGTTLNRSHDVAGNLIDENTSETGKNRWGWTYTNLMSVRWADADTDGTDGVIDRDQDGDLTENVYYQYVYDALNRRVMKKLYSSSGGMSVVKMVRFIYSGWDCIEEYEDPDGDEEEGEAWDDTPKRVYVYGKEADEILMMKKRLEIGAIVEMSFGDDDEEIRIYGVCNTDDHKDYYIVISDNNTGPQTFLITGNYQSGTDTILQFDGQDLSDYTDDQSPTYALYSPYYYHTNIQGNVIGLTNEDGDLVESIKYDIYGRLDYVRVCPTGGLTEDANDFVSVDTYYAGSTTKNPYLFQGRRYDEESGLYYFRNRYYDPLHGRFLSQDPAGPVDGPNLYAFVNNNPMNYVDPMGLLGISIDIGGFKYGIDTKKGITVDPASEISLLPKLSGVSITAQDIEEIRTAPQKLKEMPGLAWDATKAHGLAYLSDPIGYQNKVISAAFIAHVQYQLNTIHAVVSMYNDAPAFAMNTINNPGAAMMGQACGFQEWILQHIPVPDPFGDISNTHAGLTELAKGDPATVGRALHDGGAAAVDMFVPFTGASIQRYAAGVHQVAMGDVYGGWKSVTKEHLSNCEKTAVLVLAAVALAEASARGPRPVEARGCFEAGTLVNTEEGLKPIEEIKKGERVWACDPATGEWSLREVLRPLVHEYRGDVITIKVGGCEITTTGNHPFWVVRGEALAERPIAPDSGVMSQEVTLRGRWVEARDLKTGDTLLLRDGGEVRVDEISCAMRALKVYNIQVSGPHTYSVGRYGVVVHNKPMRNGNYRASKIAKAESPVWNEAKPYRGQTRISANGKYLYEWDYTHGHIEVWSKNGKRFIGTKDPVTGELTPATKAQKGRTLKNRR